VPAVLRIDHDAPDGAGVHRTADVLRRGGIVATRTDTVFGLLASVNRPDALRRLTELKVRPPGKPFVLLAADWIGVRSVTSHLPAVARVLGARYWPGPLTLVLPADENLPEEVVAAGPTVAVRIPRDRFLRSVLDELRAALAAPSANVAGEPPATCIADVREAFGPGVDLLLDDGGTPLSAASTLVDCTGAVAEILRPGPVVPGAHELAPR
jgi:L-threonylcarbamoyladenylate synthase